MPDYETLYAFLKAHYKAERFEGRNDRDYPDYSHLVARGSMEYLAIRGYDAISQHESVTGQLFIFDQQLQELAQFPWMEAEGRA